MLRGRRHLFEGGLLSNSAKGLEWPVVIPINTTTELYRVYFPNKAPPSSRRSTDGIVADVEADVVTFLVEDELGELHPC
jgi:hypothetical protein